MMPTTIAAITAAITAAGALITALANLFAQRKTHSQVANIDANTNGTLAEMRDEVRALNEKLLAIAVARTLPPAPPTTPP